jgi:deazaflavin-dependent oxidoreductase (nitroreductase family)
MRRYLIFLFLFFHNYIYIYSNGRIGKLLQGRPCLILYSTGAKTNLLRKNVLVFLKEADQICLVASKGGSPTNPGWYHNLISNPKCEIQIVRNRYNAIAREIFDDERDEWWHNMDYMNKGGYSNYQLRTSRKIPVLVLTLS